MEARERAAPTAKEEDGGGAYKEPRREGAEARIGGQGGEGGASWGWGEGLQLIPHPL